MTAVSMGVIVDHNETAMPLDEYHRKRDFDTTPEPSGLAKARSSRDRKTKERYFCVQKHLASHLHYDLRLEHDGVLLSWAVPKGPSLDSTDKRMAVQTEDHPYDYGSFEGVIPEGYGAGIVMLWDYGTWTPEVDDDDIDAALAKGDLKFSLDGYKLKGSWVLVRTRDRANMSQKQRGRNWLLIKHADFWSGPIDITEFAPLSVKSEGNFDDILADDMPDLWVTGRPATASGAGRAAKLTLDVIESAARKILARNAAVSAAKPNAGVKPHARTKTKNASPRAQRTVSRSSRASNVRTKRR